MASIEIKDLDKQKRQLKASFDMWEKTIKETEKRMSEAKNEDKSPKYTESQINDRLALLKDGEQDIIDKWFFLGGTMDELRGETKKEPAKPGRKPAGKTVLEQIAEAEEVSEKPKVRKKKTVSEPVSVRDIAETSPAKLITKMEDTNPMASYDIIPLPSKGECYKSKQGRIAVSYLTAMDENIIISPNLYRDNLVLDILLKEKIRDQEIDPDELLDGDRDAIILFLRSSAYGNMYSVTATDPVSKKSFDTKIDLSKIKYKDFTLTGDENGWFDYELPVSKDKVKFRFLTHGDYAGLAKIDKLEVPDLRKAEIDDFKERVEFYLGKDGTLSASEAADIRDAVETLVKWSEKGDPEASRFSHRASNELEMGIMSVNGNTDRKFIHDYVRTMPIRDAASLRRYIAKNTPGVDYNFEIEKPESLGGGSMPVFLQFDQFIFLVDSE